VLILRFTRYLLQIWTKVNLRSTLVKSQKWKDFISKMKKIWKNLGRLSQNTDINLIYLQWIEYWWSILLNFTENERHWAHRGIYFAVKYRKKWLKILKMKAKVHPTATVIVWTIWSPKIRNRNFKKKFFKFSSLI
jgi:hypothetical protein